MELKIEIDSNKNQVISYTEFKDRFEMWLHRAAYIPSEIKFVFFGKHEAKLVSNFDGVHLYFKDERIPQRFEYYVLKHRLHAVDCEHNFENDGALCSTVKRVFENEPVHLFTKFSKYQNRVPEKLEATKVRRGFRWAYVQEYTKHESYLETKVDVSGSAFDLMEDFMKFYTQVLAKIKRNDKFIMETEKNPLKK